jgi:thioredoxin-related protein
MKRLLVIILPLFLFMSCAKSPEDVACEFFELEESDTQGLIEYGEDMRNLSDSETLEFLLIIESKKCPKCKKEYPQFKH